MRSVGYAPAIVKWGNTCHSQHHGSEPPVHFCCSHYIFFMFSFYLPLFVPLSLSPSLPFSLSPSLPLSLSPSLPLSLSPSLPRSLPPSLPRSLSPSLPLSLSLSSLLSPLSLSLYLCLSVVARQVSYDALYQAAQCICMGCQLPYSELLEKRLFRSRANCRLVVRFISACKKSVR